MHFERLAIEAGGNTFTLDFHDRLTVIAGVGRLERDGLVNELVGALSSGRKGVHLEVRSDAGTRYTIVRQTADTARVIETDTGADVTASFLGTSGTVNLLERAGLSAAQAKRAMRVTQNDLAVKSKGEEYLLTLAHIDPNRIWDVARKCREREARLNEAAESMGSTAEDLGVFELIENRHHEFEAAQAEAERVRHFSFLAAAGAAMLSIPGLVFVGFWAAVPLLVAASTIGTYSARFWLRAEQARKREEDALAAAGAHSYLSFQIDRVNGLLADDHHRKLLLQAAEDHRASLAEWSLLAGDVPVEWAVEHRKDIDAAHKRLRATFGTRNPMSLTLDSADESTADRGHALLHRLNQLRSLGAGGESFPCFLDDPFIDAPVISKVELLELLVRASTNQQVVYLTDDPEVADWARIEAMTDGLLLVEPTEAHEDASDDDIPRRSRHVAA